VDAILTTGETVRRDQPALTIRDASLSDGRNQPWRVVFSNHPETLPMAAPLFTDAGRGRTLIRPRHDLEGTLRRLVSEQGVLSCMTEAGGVFSAALFEAGLVDEVVVYYAPLLCGGPAPGLAGAGLKKSLRLVDTEFIQLGNDIRFSGTIARNGSTD
jgi:diaminohydroxyphosphoribosylaminopyrimidine deaminase/5-amino-6-(5-phosphoribosylamino)uracil reductase